MNRNDKRFIDTEDGIRGTFLEMLREMPPERITVAELCRRAAISRGTFYLHYKDCEELLASLGEKLMHNVRGQLRHMFDSSEKLKEAVNAILNSAYRDKIAAHLMLSGSKGSGKDLQPDEGKIETIEAWTEKGALSAEQAQMIYSFITGGCCTLARDICSGRVSATQRESSDLIYNLLNNGLGALVQSEGNVSR